MNWCLYILRCRDHTLYTGITQNLQNRIRQHNNNKGARYTMKRGPVTLVFHCQFTNHTEAARAEIRIKRSSKYHREQLVAKGWDYYLSHSEYFARKKRGAALPELMEHQVGYSTVAQRVSAMSGLKSAKPRTVPSQSREWCAGEKESKKMIEKVRTNHAVAYQPWTKTTEEQLINEYQNGQRIKVIANILKRTPGAIRARLRRLGFITTHSLDLASHP